MASFPDDCTAEQAITIIFNGPALAGVGATTDAGLASDKHHVLTWDPTPKTDVEIIDGTGKISYNVIGDGASTKVSLSMALKQAIYNVDNVFAFADTHASVNAMDSAEKAILRRDAIGIVYLMTAYGYYHDECRIGKATELDAIRAITVTPDEVKTVLNTEVINRAATFILARMHTKYQTNHVLGGSPMQASMASAVRAFYNVNPSTARADAARARVDAIAKTLHWALHPANERLLIPAVINNSKITKAKVHKNGPPISVIGKEEYFAIRANTPPASTHHFYVAAAAVSHLSPLGILPYMPNIAQLSDIETGWFMIHNHGAALHPAARYWGLERITANQKLVEPVCANLGYAVRKLMAGSSLASSPILAKEDALDAGWKSFVDSLRAVMDERGKEMMSEEIMNDIRARIAPKASDTNRIESIKQLLIQGAPFRAEPTTEPSQGAAAGPSEAASTVTT
jgi:hypothetical protein